MLGGLIVPKAGFFPASVINNDSFSALVGIPVQFFRALSALGIAYSLWHIINIFNIEETAERRQADENVQRYAEGLQIYKDVAKNTQIGLSIWWMENTADVKTFKPVALNPAAELFLGLKSEDALEKSMIEIFPGILNTEVPSILAEVVRSGKAKELGEVYHSHKKKPNAVFSLKAFPLPSSCIGISFEDITERKKAEEALQKAYGELEKRVEERTAELKKSEEKYSSLVEKSSDGIVIIQNGLLKFANSQIGEITGFLPKEVIGKPFIEFISPEFRELVMDRYKKRMSGKEVPAKYETELLSKDGRRIPVEISASLIEYENKPADMAIIRDITERKKAEEALKNHAKELEEANKLKDLFTDIMRHDLLNPAGMIRNFSEMVIEETSSEKQKELMLRVKSNADKLIEMIEAATMYARLENNVEEDKVELDLNEVIRTAANELMPMIEEKKMKLACLAKGECRAMANPMIENVFSNLLSNAVKYSPEGKKIEVNIIDEDKNWKIYVKDWGYGISGEDKAKLFSRFQRADKKGVKGTGLGLAIVKRIVELHKGRVWIEDNPEGGSIFYVEIPKA